MSELPRTDEFSRSEEEYDATPIEVTRVEEAFASFAERVHELESVAGELRAELRSLRSQRERLDYERAPAAYESERWPSEDGEAPGGPAPSPDWTSASWVSSVPAPLSRPIAIPRLALEAIFLVLVALLAGLADLSTTAIVVVMVAAWALVVISEWAAAAKRARWRLESVATPTEESAAGVSDSTGPWSIPVVEATVVEAPDESESHTVVTKLPPEPEAEPEAEAEPAPAAEAAPELEAQPEAEPETTEPELEPVEPAEPAVAEATAEADPVSGLPIPPEGPEAEPEPKRRRWFRRRRGGDEPDTDAPDPWEL